jgi:hypothetical protein
MKLLTLLSLGIALAAGNAVAADSSFQQRAAAHPALYSFVDVYRLTVSGPMPGPAAEQAGEAPIRVAAPQSQPNLEARFSVSARRQPDNKWLLLLAGLALAGWVAHRRLVHSL